MLWTALTGQHGECRIRNEIMKLVIKQHSIFRAEACESTPHKIYIEERVTRKSTGSEAEPVEESRRGVHWGTLPRGAWGGAHRRRGRGVLCASFEFRSIKSGLSLRLPGRLGARRECRLRAELGFGDICNSGDWGGGSRSRMFGSV